jgi:hypothetical protein
MVTSVWAATVVRSRARFNERASVSTLQAIYTVWRIPIPCECFALITLKVEEYVNTTYDTGKTFRTTCSTRLFKTRPRPTYYPKTVFEISTNYA